MSGQSPALPDRVLADLEPTLGLAAVLTGSTPGATDLVADALARDTGWARIDDDADLHPYLRTAVVRGFLASPLGRSRPPARAAGLDALAGPARAAVALRDGEHLTTSEIATVTDRPAGRVVADLAATATGAHDAEIADLVAAAPAPEAVARRFGSAASAVRRTHRRRTGVLASAAIVVLAVVAVPTLVVPRLPVEVRDPGSWHYTHEVVLAPGWELAARAIQAEQEMTTLLVPWRGDDSTECTVTVRVAGALPDRADGDVEPTSVRTRPAEIITRSGNAVGLHWQYAPGAWATAECDTRAEVGTDLLRDLANAVRFREGRQLLPFTVTALPDGYRIQLVGETFADRSGFDWGPVVLLEPPENSYRAGIIIGPDLASLNDSGRFDTTVRCLGPDRAVCVTAFPTDDQIPPNHAMLRRTLAKTVADVELATDPADRSTWIDASTLPSS